MSSKSWLSRSSFPWIITLLLAYFPPILPAQTTYVDLKGTDGASSALGDGGAGGDAVTTVGALAVLGIVGTEGFFRVIGGQGGDATGPSGNGGAAGNASLTSTGSVGVTMGILRIVGGDGGDSASGGGGASGQVAVSIASVSLSDGLLYVLGGLEGHGATGDGTASSVFVTLGAVSLIEGSEISISGRNGPCQVSVLGALTAQDSMLGFGEKGVTLTASSVAMTRTSLEMNQDEGDGVFSVAGSLGLDQGHAWVGGQKASVSAGSVSLSGAATLSVNGVDAAALTATGDVAVGSGSSITIVTEGGSAPGSATTDVRVGGVLSLDHGLLKTSGGGAFVTAGALTMTTGIGFIWNDSASVSLGSLGMGADSYLMVGNPTGDGTSGSLQVAGATRLGDTSGVGTLSVLGRDVTVSFGSDLTLSHESYLSLYGAADGTSRLQCVGPVSIQGGGVLLNGKDVAVTLSSDLDLVGAGVFNVAGTDDGSAVLVGGGDLRLGDATTRGTLSVTGGTAALLALSDLRVVNRSSLGINSPLTSASGSGLLNVGGDLSIDRSAVEVWGSIAYAGMGSLTASNASTLRLYAGPSGSAALQCDGGASILGSFVDVLGQDASLSVGSMRADGGATFRVVSTGGVGSFTAAGPVSLGDVSLVVSGVDVVWTSGDLTGGAASRLRLDAAATGAVACSIGGSVTLDGGRMDLSGGSVSLSVGSYVGSNASTLLLDDGGVGGVDLSASGAVSLSGSRVDLESGTTAAFRSGSLLVLDGSTLDMGANGGSLFESGGVSIANASVSVMGQTAAVSIGRLDLSDTTAVFTVGGATLASARVDALYGLGSLDVTSGPATLRVTEGDFSGRIGGTCGLEKTGILSDSLTLRGANTYSGATTVAGGSLVLDTLGTLGTSGWVTIGNAGTLGFMNAASAGGLTIQNDGRLVFADSSDADDARVVSSSGATVRFAGSATGATASFHQAAGSVFDLSASTFGVTVGSLDGAGDVFLGSKNLCLGIRALSTTLSGVLSDGGLSGGTLGSLTQWGPGSVVLTGSNTFTGGVSVLGGELSVGSVGALGGGDVRVLGGTLSASGANHALVVAGDYLQGPLGILSLRLAGAHSSDDSLEVGGSATLGGTLSLEPSGVAPALGGTLRAVSVLGDLTGTFAAVTDTFDDRRFLPIYLSGSVDLRVVPGSYTQVGLTEDQKAVGGALDKLFDGSDPQGTAFIWSLSALTAEQYPAVLEGMNPSCLSSFFQARYRVAGFQTSAVEGRAIDLLERRNGFGDRKTLLRYADAGKPSEETALGTDAGVPSQGRMGRWGGFLAADAGDLSIEGDENGEGYEVSLQGLTAAGVDYRLRPHLAVGLMVGYQDAKIDSVRGSHLALQGGQVGLYGVMSARDFHFQASLVGGKDRMDLDRVSNGGVAEGETDGGVFSGMVGAGYRTSRGRWGLRPSISLQYTRVSMGAFEEKGSTTPLTYEDQSGSSVLGTMGVQGTGELHLGRHLALRPGIAASCLYELKDEGGEVVSAIHGAAFTAKGCEAGSSGVRLEASLEAQWKKDVGLSFHYQEDVGRDNYDAKTFGGQLRFNL